MRTSDSQSRQHADPRKKESGSEGKEGAKGSKARIHGHFLLLFGKLVNALLPFIEILVTLINLHLHEVDRIVSVVLHLGAIT